VEGRSGGCDGRSQWELSAGAIVFRPEQFDGKIDTYRTHEDNQPQGYLSGGPVKLVSLEGFSLAWQVLCLRRIVFASCCHHFWGFTHKDGDQIVSGCLGGNYINSLHMESDN